MAQLTIDLDPQTIQELEQAAQESGLPLGDWIARMLQSRPSSHWSPGVEALVGAWVEAPTSQELRSSEVPDVPRELF